MKRIFFIFILTGLISNLFGQQYVDLNAPVIDSTNAPRLGDTVQFVNLFGSDTFDPGNPGEGIIWDLSGIVEYSDSLETYLYVDTLNYPHVPQTSQVVEAMQEMPENYFYFNYGDNNDLWQRTGFYSYDATSDFSLWIDYVTDVKLLKYPLQYGNTGSSVPNYEGIGHYILGTTAEDSAGVDNGNYNYEVDAWGVLITPYKTYKNVLRVHSSETFDMHLFLWGSAWENDHFEDNSYFWYSPEAKSYVLKFIVSTTTTGNGTQTTRYFAWQKVTPTQVEPDFTVSDTNVYSHIDTVRFLNLSSPIALCDFQWEITPANYVFVDSTDQNSVNPKVVFTQPGDYTVTLTASNNQLGTESLTKTQYIHVESAPKLEASFYAENPIIDINGIVIFHNTTNYTDGTTWQWQVTPGSQGNHWDFVDFTTNTDFEPHIQFYQAGCYSIRLVATNDQFYNSPDDTIMLNYINVAGGCGDAYTVTFTVTDQATGDPISGASVDVSGVGTHTTDDNGQTTFSLYNGTYNYSVSATAYSTETGSFTVNNDDVSIDVQLVKSQYIATFTVTDSATGNPISGATVVIEGVETHTTDDNGQCQFALDNGTYNYTVSASGYEDATGELTINGEDVDVNVTLKQTNSYVFDLPKLSVYPNPAHKFVTIAGINGTVYITDMTGKILITEQVKGAKRININLPEGVYIIKVIASEGNKTEKLIVK